MNVRGGVPSYAVGRFSHPPRTRPFIARRRIYERRLHRELYGYVHGGGTLYAFAGFSPFPRNPWSEDVRVLRPGESVATGEGLLWPNEPSGKSAAAETCRHGKCGTAGRVRQNDECGPCVLCTVKTRMTKRLTMPEERLVKEIESPGRRKVAN